MVLSSLYRKIIELSEGVRVSAENGLASSVELNYRGLIEAYLAFKYIVQETELMSDRAKAYKIGYHKQQIEAGQYSLGQDLDGNERLHFERAMEFHQNELEREDLQEVLAE